MAGKCVAVLDVRSSDVSVLYGERGVNHSFVVKASTSQTYNGYQDGEFYSVEDFSSAVRKAVESVEQICGEKLSALYVGVPGEFTEVVPKEQVLGFPKRQKIGAKEIDALFKSGQDEMRGYRFMRVSSMIYVTSDNRRVSNPTGLYSSGLSGVLSYFYVSEYFAQVVEKIFAGSTTQLYFLPTQFATASYLISPETRDEYALFLDVGYLSSTICVLLGNGVLAQRTFWTGKGQIAVRLMQKFGLSYEAANALLAKSNLYVKKESRDKEFNYRGATYIINTQEFIEEVKAGLDDLCENVSAFMEECSGKELDSKPLYVSGEGLDGIRGALEHLSKRLSCVCESLSPDLPYYNKPAMSSRIALADMAYEDNRKGKLLYKFLKIFGG